VFHHLKKFLNIKNIEPVELIRHIIQNLGSESKR